MLPSLHRYKSDLDSLLARGDDLYPTMVRECSPARYVIAAQTPSFAEAYQVWYSEAKVLIKQLLPDRLHDFVRHYEKPKPRKQITYENYRIEDYLQRLEVTRGRGKEKVVGPEAAIPHLQQQLAILKSVQKRFDSSLFELRLLVQADLFDS